MRRMHAGRDTRRERERQRPAYGWSGVLCQPAGSAGLDQHLQPSNSLTWANMRLYTSRTPNTVCGCASFFVLRGRQRSTPVGRGRVLHPAWLSCVPRPSATNHPERSSERPQNVEIGLTRRPEQAETACGRAERGAGDPQKARLGNTPSAINPSTSHLKAPSIQCSPPLRLRDQVANCSAVGVRNGPDDRGGRPGECGALAVPSTLDLRFSTRRRHVCVAHSTQNLALVAQALLTERLSACSQGYFSPPPHHSPAVTHRAARHKPPQTDQLAIHGPSHLPSAVQHLENLQQA